MNNQEKCYTIKVKSNIYADMYITYESLLSLLKE